MAYIYIYIIIPFKLSKRIIVFVSNDVKVESRLLELKNYLLYCDYPEEVIENNFYKARLEGPAPKPTSKVNIIPFVTTNYGNIDLTATVNTIRYHLKELSSNCVVIFLKKSFKNFIIIKEIYVFFTLKVHCICLSAISSTTYFYYLLHFYYLYIYIYIFIEAFNYNGVKFLFIVLFWRFLRRCRIN